MRSVFNIVIILVQFIRFCIKILKSLQFEKLNKKINKSFDGFCECNHYILAFLVWNAFNILHFFVRPIYKYIMYSYNAFTL